MNALAPELMRQMRHLTGFNLLIAGTGISRFQPDKSPVYPGRRPEFQRGVVVSGHSIFRARRRLNWF